MGVYRDSFLASVDGSWQSCEIFIQQPMYLPRRLENFAFGIYMKFKL